MNSFCLMRHDLYYMLYTILLYFKQIEIWYCKMSQNVFHLFSCVEKLSVIIDSFIFLNFTFSSVRSFKKIESEIRKCIMNRARIQKLNIRIGFFFLI